MDISDLTLLGPGVFELEKGHGGWNINDTESMKIAFTSIESESKTFIKPEIGQKVSCVMFQTAVGEPLTAFKVFRRHSSVLKHTKSIQWVIT